MAFAQKILRVTFTLSNGTFAASGNNTLSVSGLKTQVTVKNAGMFSGCQLTLAVYGMTLSQMNDCSTVQPQAVAIYQNHVTVEASSDGGANYSTVFIGTVMQGFTDLTGMPDAVFRCTANSVAGVNVQSAAPGGINAAVNVAVLLQSLCSSANPPLNFENNGVNVTIRNPYLWGSVGDNIKELCDAAGIAWVIQNGTLAIWPKSGSRTPAGAVVPIVSAATGLVAFPSFTPYGVLLKTLYNSSIVFGGQIQVESELLTNALAQSAGVSKILKLPSNGIYTVVSLDHELESWVPNGKWFSDIYCWTGLVVVPQ